MATDSARSVLRVEGADRLRTIARQLRELGEGGREIRRRMTREMRRAGTELVRAERAAVRALPSKGESARRGRPGLRQAIARATQLQVKTAGRNPLVRVWVNPKRLPDGQMMLPPYMEGERGASPWRHPVFGNSEVWVSQEPKPWFWRTAARYRGNIDHALLRALRDVEDEIRRRTGA